MTSRLPPLFFFLLTCLVALGLVSAHAGAHAHGRAASFPAERQAKFNERAAQEGGVVKLDLHSFDEFIARPRNYSVSMLLTATDPLFKCHPCRQFDPEYNLVAKAWQKSPEKERHIFGRLDFMNGKEIFQRMGLQHAPMLYFYPPTEGPYATGKTDPVEYDFNRFGFDAGDLADTISGQISGRVPFRKPPPYGLIITALVIGSIAVLIGTVFFSSFTFVLTSKYLWQVLGLGMILVMTSGYMWNRIRGTPYVAAGPDGTVSYIAAGFQNQYGMETQIVATLYGILSISVIALTILVPKQTDPFRQRLGVYIWSGVLLFVFSVLINVFRMKNGGYPFRLFL